MEYKVFGCKVNKFYINKWMEYFAAYPSFVEGNNCLVATCVVTDRAKAKRVKDVRKRLESGQRVFLTGCGAFEKGKAMDYDTFFAIYPTLLPHKESIFLLGEDPADYNEHLQVADYDLNKEIGDAYEASNALHDTIPNDDQHTAHKQETSLYDRVMGRLVDGEGRAAARPHSDQDMGFAAISFHSDQNTSFTATYPHNNKGKRFAAARPHITQPSQDSLYTRKFIVIQSGCDTFCTFCLTIYKRGSNRTRPAEEIIQEINDFVATGGKEIIITGVNLAAYGCSNTRKPQENTFTALLQKIIDETSVQRIRISSLGPEFLDDEFFDLMANPRFLPHFHFSIQSFSDKVLKKMNRNYDAAILDNVLTKIRQIDITDPSRISIGADIIVGFPGEDEDEFSITFEAIQKYGITKLHAFPFSPHQKGETVPAGKFEQISMHSKKERERRLLAEGERVRQQFLRANKGKKFTVLVENKKDGKRTGWTENYIKIALDGDYTRGDLVEVNYEE